MTIVGANTTIFLAFYIVLNDIYQRKFNIGIHQKIQCENGYIKRVVKYNIFYVGLHNIDMMYNLPQQ